MTERKQILTRSINFFDKINTGRLAVEILLLGSDHRTKFGVTLLCYSYRRAAPPLNAMIRSQSASSCRRAPQPQAAVWRVFRSEKWLLQRDGGHQTGVQNSLSLASRCWKNISPSSTCSRWCSIRVNSTSRRPYFYY